MFKTIKEKIFYKALGLAIFLERDKQKLTRGKFIEKYGIGVTIQQLQKYERGTDRAPFYVLCKIFPSLDLLRKLLPKDEADA